MQITFLGATRTVTGAKYLVEDGATRVLVDCGLFQGEKALRLRNWAPLPVHPSSLAAVVLTHAHLDHSGYVPLLVARGFSGRVHCSAGTHELCRILLPDSGRLQEEEAAFANRHGYSKHTPALPLYTEAQAQRCLGRFAPSAFDTDVAVAPNVSVRFRPAGHILGASTVTLTMRATTIAFSGDLGRPHDPGDPEQALADVVNRTVARGGKVVIPSFAVGRAQALLHALARLKARGAIPPTVPVYLDSPMATDVTALYMRFRGQHRLSADACAAIGRSAHLVTTPEESRRLDEQRMPMVIIAASGMVTGGRVLHHLRALAGDARNTILFSGHQANGTRGAAIASGAPEVKMLGQWVPIRAEVAMLQGLSAHADYAEIMQWLRGFTAAPKATFVTHGEPAAAEALRQRIVETLGWRAETPEYLQTVRLD